MPTKRKTTLSDRELWDQKAEDWHRQVGDAGDLNRRLNSDPVLWRFLGSIGGLDVLDAGCGTGYLARQLARKGGRVTGVDFSGDMIALACRLASEQGLEMALMEDDCTGLSRIADASQDRVVSNYVLPMWRTTAPHCGPSPGSCVRAVSRSWSFCIPAFRWATSAVTWMR